MNATFVRPDMAAFLERANQADASYHKVTPEQAREKMRLGRPLVDMEIGPIAVNRALGCPGPAGEIGLRLFDARAERGPGPVLLFLHGGGFVLGDTVIYQPLCAELARALDIPVVSADYRLAPEHVWPAAPDDCEAVARWIADNPAVLGREATALAISGDSAGGNIAIVTTLALRDRPARVPVIGQLLIYPQTDFSAHRPSEDAFADGYYLTREAMEWFHAHYAPDYTDPRASPLLADQAGMPPSVIATGSLDPLRDGGRAYAAKLVEAGVDVIYQEARGVTHGFACIRKAVPSAQADLARLLAAFRTVIDR